MAKKNAKKQSELAREVGLLAEKIGQAIKGAAQSREVSEIQAELKSSLRSVSGRVVKAVKKASRSQALGEIKGQTKKVVSLGKKEGLAATQDLRKNLCAGLDAAGQELKRLAERLKKQA